MKRNLLVPTADKAVELMKSFLASQLIDAELERDGENDDAPYFVKLVWLSRDLDSNRYLGCPCFVADFHGKMPDGNHVRGIVYVKCFPTQVTQITKMKIVDQYLDYNLDFIQDGEKIRMHDDKCRYKDENYIYKDGVISLL